MNNLRFLSLIPVSALVLAVGTTQAQGRGWPAAPVTAEDSVAPLSAKRVLTREEAIQHDAKSYANLQGVSYPEALAWSRAKDGMGTHFAALRTDFSGRITGIFFEYEPAYKIIVRLAGSQPIEQRSLSAGGTKIPDPLNAATSEFLDADQDVEVHTSPAVERGQFYADSTTTARVLTGRRLLSSTAAGDEVCHRGATTGYSCGMVAQTNYAPMYAGACGSVACSAVYVKVNGGTATKCYGGDSGGPVFASQTAFGLLKSAAATGSGAGQCSYFTYMSTDFLPTGRTLQYGP